MKLVKATVIGLFFSVLASQASACELVKLLSNKMRVSFVSNKDYQSYLWRNNKDDSILLEMVPRQWGFDLRSADGRVLASLNKFYDFKVSERSCAKHWFALQPAGNLIHVYDRRDLIGTLYDVIDEMVP